MSDKGETVGTAGLAQTALYGLKAGIGDGAIVAGLVLFPANRPLRKIDKVFLRDSDAKTLGG